jgi:ADP-dependent phosphofructokinase/glucokinase
MPSFVAVGYHHKDHTKDYEEFFNNYLNKNCKERKNIRKLENLRTHLEAKQCLHNTKDYVLEGSLC